MLRSADKWFAGYVKSVLRRPPMPDGLKHLMFCVVDHFEPFRGDVPRKQALSIVARWVNRYPEETGGLRDGDGETPKHTFFCAAEEYDRESIDMLGKLCGSGHGEIEIHLHHRADTPESLRAKLTQFRDTLHEVHGLLGCDKERRTKYGFIHGNWALCNSLPGGDWCGVNEELSILRDTGCYADFTFPSAPSPTQPRIVNAIYRARDIPGRPRSHDYGTAVAARKAGPLASYPLPLAPCPSSLVPRPSSLDTCPSLMLIQGPLGLNWRQRKLGILPRLENAEVAAHNPPTPARIDLWVRQHIHVQGRPEWVFVKVHTHGAVEGNAGIFLDDAQGTKPGIRNSFQYLREHFNDGHQWKLHWVSAREMYNIIRAAEDGASGDPGCQRNYEISPPARGKKVNGNQ